MFKTATAVLALLCAWGMSQRVCAEELTALDETALPALTAVTGFHSLHDATNQLFFRLMEADASAAVARNPVALFLVISNDAGGPDLQEHVWRLPAVAAVKKFSLAKSGLQIAATVDGPVNEKTGRLPEHAENWVVTYSFVKKRLSEHITIRPARPQTL